MRVPPGKPVIYVEIYVHLWKVHVRVCENRFAHQNIFIWVCVNAWGFYSVCEGISGCVPAEIGGCVLAVTSLKYLS